MWTMRATAAEVNGTATTQETKDWLNEEGQTMGDGRRGDEQHMYEVRLYVRC